jgi:hypothetical protein
MSKVCSRIKGIDGVSTGPGSSLGYEKGPQMSSSGNIVVKTVYTKETIIEDTLIIIPPHSITLTAKMWGAGGNNSWRGGRTTNGGGGGYAEYTIPVIEGQIYVVSVGSGGDGGKGGEHSSNSGGMGGNGGGMSVLLFKNAIGDENYTVKAVAGGGGGGGSANYTNIGYGGGGGQDGIGDNYGKTIKIIRDLIDPTSGGMGGIGAATGEDFVDSVTLLSDINGGGGQGRDSSSQESVISVCGGGGGNGRGGGGGGGFYSGGGGGGNYSEAGLTINGNGRIPGNNDDEDRPAGIGEGALGSTVNNTGSPGAIVIIITGEIFHTIKLPDETKPGKASTMNILGAENTFSIIENGPAENENANAENTPTGDENDYYGGGDLSINGGKSQEGRGGDLLLNGGKSDTSTAGIVKINGYVSYPSIRGIFDMNEASATLYSDNNIRLFWNGTQKRPNFTHPSSDFYLTSIIYNKLDGDISSIHGPFTKQSNGDPYFTSNNDYTAVGIAGSYILTIAPFDIKKIAYHVRIFYNYYNGYGRYIVDIVPGKL